MILLFFHQLLAEGKGFQNFEKLIEVELKTVLCASDEMATPKSVKLESPKSLSCVAFNSEVFDIMHQSFIIWIVCLTIWKIRELSPGLMCCLGQNRQP